MAPSRGSGGASRWQKLVGDLVNAARGVRGARESISPDALRARLEAEDAPAVLDVRTEAEFREGRVPGAVLVPHEELADRLEEVPAGRDEEIVVYCEAGVRAAVAEDVLAQAGYRRVLHLEGDMAQWRARGLPTER